MPPTVDAAVVRPRTETPPPVREPGDKDAVTPRGIPLAVRFTRPLNPFSAVTVIEELDPVPAIRFNVVGNADIVKSGVVTKTLTITERVKAPLVPVTVKVV